MEFDPATNTYTSNGPTRRLATAESEVSKLRKEVKELQKRIEDIEYRLESKRI